MRFGFHRFFPLFWLYAAPPRATIVGSRDDRIGKNMQLRIALPYHNFGDGHWSDQMDRCREMEVERLKGEEIEGDHPPEQQLDASEIADLLENATGHYSKAYEYIASEYVRFLDSVVSERLNLPVGLTAATMLPSKDYFVEGDAIHALISLEGAHNLFYTSSREKHRRFRREMGWDKQQFGELAARALNEWNEQELGALLASLIDVADVEAEVFSDMAESSDCFYADSAIDWASYNAAADEIRRHKKAAWREPNFVSRIPRAIRSNPVPADVQHPCEGLPLAEVRAFDALASGENPIRAENALARLVQRGLILEAEPPFNVSECIGPATRYHYSIPVSLHVKWCQWAKRRALDGKQVHVIPTGDGVALQPSLFELKR